MACCSINVSFPMSHVTHVSLSLMSSSPFMKLFLKCCLISCDIGPRHAGGFLQPAVRIMDFHQTCQVVQFEIFVMSIHTGKALFIQLVRGRAELLTEVSEFFSKLASYAGGAGCRGICCDCCGCSTGSGGAIGVGGGSPFRSRSKTDLGPCKPALCASL